MRGGGAFLNFTEITLMEFSMLNPFDFIISSAFAQESVPAPQSGTDVLMNYLPFILIFLVFYVLVIRPQQKRLSEQDKMVRALKRGDRIVTSSGIHGKVAKIDEKDDFLMLEIAEGVQVKIDRSNVSSLEAKTEPVPAESKKEKDK